MQDTTFYADRPPDYRQGTPHHRTIQRITALLPVLILVIIGGSLAGLQYAGQLGITLGYPQPHVQIAAPSSNKLIRTQSYQFSATARGRDLSYFWDFGDQNADTGAVVSHTYQDINNYTVTVTVTDPAGHQATQSISVEVVPPVPQASFTYSDGYNGYVYFDASSSSADASTSIASYSWDFGDGSSPDNIPYPQDSHYYANSGSYQVTLTVFDATGQASTPYVITISI